MSVSPTPSPVPLWRTPVPGKRSSFTLAPSAERLPAPQTSSGQSDRQPARYRGHPRARSHSGLPTAAGA